MSRKSQVRASLEGMRAEGFIASWEVLEDAGKRRWVVEAVETLELSTREAEAFIAGAYSVRFSDFLDEREGGADELVKLADLVLDVDRGIAEFSDCLSIARLAA